MKNIFNILMLGSLLTVSSCGSDAKEPQAKDFKISLGKVKVYRWER